MKLKLSLLENSYDFLNNAMFFVRQSEQMQCSWKFAIINIVQSMELMFKERLRQTHERFIYDNIDKPRHTVSITLALERLIGICNIKLGQDDRIIIHKAIEWRNQMMHYEVDISIDEVKARFALLFEFLSHFHKEYLGEELHKYIAAEYWEQEAELVELFKNKFVIYNGVTIEKEFAKEIIIAQNLTHYYIEKTAYPRVPYGKEKNWLKVSSDFAEVACHDCAVVKGQLHVPGCDVEACPKCGNSAIVCGCKYDEDEEGYVLFKSIDGKKYV